MKIGPGCITGTVLAVLGLSFIIGGAIIPGIVNGALEAGVTQQTTIGERDEPADGLRGDKTEPYFGLTVASEQTYYYYFYNYTNADAVLAGAKPIVQEVAVAFTKNKRKYDIKLDDAADTASYRTYTWFEPKKKSDWNLTINTVNPVYFGGIGGVAKEAYLQAFFIPNVLSSLETTLTIDVASGFALNAFPTYLGGLMQQVLAADVLTGGTLIGGTQGFLARWYNATMPSTRDKLFEFADYLSSATTTPAPNPNASATNNTGRRLTPAEDLQKLAGALEYFQLPASLINPAVPVMLWDQAGGASLLNTHSLVKWASVNRTLWPELYNVLKETPGYDRTLPYGEDSPLKKDMINVGEWLDAKLKPGSPQNSVYFAVVKGGVAATFPSWFASIKDCQNFADIGLMQLSTSFVSTMGGMKDHDLLSVSPKEKPIFEFYAWQVQIYKTPPLFEMSLAQTKQLFKVMTNSSNIPTFLAFLAAGRALMATGVVSPTFYEDYAEFIATGVMGATTAFYYYLVHYLPETFYFSTLRAQNTGFFTKRSVHELLHGWRDNFANGKLFPGYEGKENTPDVAPTGEDRDPPTVVYRGTQDTKKIGVYKADLGVEEFWLATDLGKSCPSAALYASDPEASQCHIWRDKEVIKGKQDPLTLPPLGKIDEPLKSFSAWVSSLTRAATFDFEKQVEYEGIKMHRYKLTKSALQSSQAHPKMDAATKKIQDGYRVTSDGFTDISTVMGMVPAFLGGPRHIYNPAEAAKIQGLTKGDWEDKEESKYNVVIDIEPTTGKAMYGRQRLQFNMQVSNDQLNGFHSTVWFGGNNSNHTFYPVWWQEDGAQIEADQAKAFTDTIYGAVYLGNVLQWTLIILGIILLLLGAGLVFKFGVRGSSAAPKKTYGVQMIG